MPKFLAHAPAYLLAAFLVFMGVQKFGAENVIFATIAERSGIGLFEPVIRIIVGVSEIAVAGLLLAPRLRLFGALGAVGVIGGAIGFHLSPWLGVSTPMAPGGAESPVLFVMAIGSFALAVVVLLRARAKAAQAWTDLSAHCG